MKLRLALFLCGSLLVGALGATSAVPAPMPIDEAAKLFGARPTAFAPDLSPGGDKLVYLAAGPGASTIVHLMDLANKSDKPLVNSSGKPEQLFSCNFVDERWVACRIGGWMHESGFIYPVARTIAVDTISGKIRRLGSTGGGASTQFDGEVLDWLPDENGALIIEHRYPGINEYPDRIGVDRVELDPFRVRPVEPPIARDLSYMTDGHGTVRLRSEEQSDSDDLFTGRATYEYRLAGSSSWTPLGNTAGDFQPLVIDRSSNSLYFLRALHGRDALYRMKLDGSARESLIASNPDVDIDTVIELGPGQPVVGYRYTDDRTHSVYFDATMQSLGNALARALPNMPLINYVASSRSGDKLLIHGGSDVDPGVFFVLDRKSNRMDPVLNSSELIDGNGLAPMKAVTVPTSDGKTIPAYVTMRTDLLPGPHPLVVMPHGGPSARDTWGFDWLGQFLAARGYVVIQPNFRGSSGYGKEFLGENAFHDWRMVMSDIRDSANWLIKQGLADPKKMAIVGWSYGGYAALQTAAIDQRYKAVVAIAAVTDLKQLRRDAKGFRDQNLSKSEIGTGDQLVDGSPIRHAADIHAPVLMVHGTLDGNVPYDHSRRMLDALKAAGNSADLLTFEGLDHQLDDSDARRMMLTKIGQFLDAHLGG